MAYNVTIITPQKTSIPTYPQSNELLYSGSTRAVSFTDDTSTDKRKTRRHISVSAKVSKEASLDWYYAILKKCQTEVGELKEVSLKIFRLLPKRDRWSLWDTLRLVQINISDPLPYQRKTEQALESVSKKEVTIQKIRDRAIANDPIAKSFLESINNHTAEQILFDAPSRRLETMLHFFNNPLALASINSSYPIAPMPESRIELDRLKSRNRGAIIRAATEWTAKSASAFSEAIDLTMSGRYRPYEPFNPVYMALRKAHAFDEGNELAIE